MVSEKGPGGSGQESRPTRPLTELLRSLANDTGELLRREIALARAEIRLAVRTAASAASRAAVGAGLGGVGLLTILAGIVVLIGSLIGSYWLSALLVGGVLVAVGAWSAFAGVKRMGTVDPAPRQAIESTRETVEWARREAAELRAGLLGRTLPEPARRTERIGGSPAHPHPQLRAPAGPGSAVPAVSAERSVAGRGPERTPSASAGGGPQPLLKRVVREIQKDRITSHAASLAYYAFLAMPPSLMALFGLAGLVGSEQIAGWLEEQAALALPPAVTENIIGPFIEQVVLEEAPGPFSIGLLLALWGGSALFSGLIDTLNQVFDIEETRPFLRKRLLALAVMLTSVILFLGAAGALLVAPALVDMLGLGEAGRFLWNLAQWPVAFTFMVAAFWGAYRFLPNHPRKGSNRLLLRGAAIAAALWVLATAGFRLYIANFSSYSDTYGFLGAFIILLLWLYVTGLVVLAGGELASEMERGRERT